MNDNTPEGDEIPAETPEVIADEPVDEVAKLQADLAKMRDQWMRTAAELDNVRKRAARDQEETARYATTSFARDMVSVLEHLRLASQGVPADKRAESELLNTIGVGIDMTLNELLQIFERQGIKRIDPMGQKFDHNLHQAVVQIPREDVPPGTVVQVVQAGYTLHDRLLRPAMVAVSMAVDPAKKVDTTA